MWIDTDRSRDHCERLLFYYYKSFSQVYSEMQKSELVWFSDNSLLAQFQTVRFSESVQNPNDFGQFFCLKTECP